MKNNHYSKYALLGALLTGAPAFAQDPAVTAEPTAPVAPVEATATEAQATPTVTAETTQQEALAEEFAETYVEEFAPAEELRDYVSVSTKYTQPSIETPASVSVISRQQINRMGYRSVGEALRSLPGVYVSYDLVNYHVGLRGAFGGARAGSRLLKIMVDGMPVPFTQAETYFMGPEFIPISAVERIEVLRGPASSLYGAGAYSGAINVVTRRSAYEGETMVHADVRGYGGGGGQTLGGVDVMAEVTSAGGQVLVAGSGFMEDRSNLNTADTGARFAVTGTSDTDEATPFSVYAKTDQQVFGGRFIARGLFQGHSREAEFHDLAPLGETYTGLSNWRLMAGYERAFGEGWSAAFSGGVGGASTLASDKFARQQDSFYIERDLSSTQFLGNFELRREFENGGFALVGFDGSSDSQQLPTFTEYDPTTELPTASTPRFGREVSITTGGAFAQLVMPIAEVVTVSASGRGDVHSEVDAQGGFRVAAVTTFSDRFALKVIGGSSYKAPSPEQLYALPIVNENDIAGARVGDGYDLKTQYLYGGEAGVEVYPTAWSQLAVTGFYNLYLDTIGYQLEGTNLTAQNYDATNVGAEALARVFYSFHNEESFVDFATSLSLQNTTTEEVQGALAVEKDFPDNEIVPSMMVKVRGGLRLAPAYSTLTAEVLYHGERVPSQSNLTVSGTTTMADPTYTLDPFTTLNLAYSTTPIDLGGPFSVALMVKGENLLDSRYAEIGFNGIDVPGLGRTVWTRLNFTM